MICCSTLILSVALLSRDSSTQFIVAKPAGIYRVEPAAGSTVTEWHGGSFHLFCSHCDELALAD